MTFIVQWVPQGSDVQIGGATKRDVVHKYTEMIRRSGCSGSVVAYSSNSVCICCFLRAFCNALHGTSVWIQSSYWRF